MKTRPCKMLIEWNNKMAMESVFKSEKLHKISTNIVLYWRVSFKPRADETADGYYRLHKTKVVCDT